MSKGAAKKANYFDSDSDSESNPKPSKGSYSGNPASKSQYKNDFKDSGGLENQSVQELEHYAAHKSEETTHEVNNCLKIAEEIKEDATRTLATLHEQGEQIHRTHEMAIQIDQDLSRGEKILGSLGGIFSMTWKPKKTRQIKGPIPVITKEDSFKKKKNHMEQREKLGLSSSPRSKARQYSEPTSAMDKVQIEKAKQDDSLDDLSGILGQLKGMAVDMGSELERQNKALDALDGDVDELNSRVKGANQRTRKLLK